jgi:hypothetical protein
VTVDETSEEIDNTGENVEENTAGPHGKKKSGER